MSIRDNIVIQPSSLSAQKRRRAITKKLRFKIKASGDDFEGAAGDGYIWRKYGQKPVLNSIYPRRYYKCQAKSCEARKQIRRSENDPTTIDVIYSGVHTCLAIDPTKSEVISSSSNMGDIRKQIRRSENDPIYSGVHTCLAIDPTKSEVISSSSKSEVISSSSNMGDIEQHEEYSLPFFKYM